MTSESMSARRSQDVPATAAEHLGLAERFSSFAEYAISTATLPQTAATSLDVARFHAFTGELTFSVDPAVRLYLDGGSVYHAERDGGPSVSSILLDAGVIDTVQLRRGVVSVGDVEHLGRLFDRDATVDRDAVMVVLEGATNALVQKIANSVIATVTVSAYRHHPCGIHRWFVAPVEPKGAQRPASGVMQIDRSVVEELPRLGAPAATADADAKPAPTAAESMSIEWDEPDPSSLGLPVPMDEDPSPPPVADIDVDIQAELDRFDADRADWTAASGGNNPDASEAVPSPLGEFRIVWPNGTRDEMIVAAEDPIVDDHTTGEHASTDQPAIDRPVVLDPPTAAALEPRARDLAPPLRPVDEAVGLPAPTSASEAVGLTVEPLQIDRIPEPNAAVPDDVAAAVRRALQAIESAVERPADTSVPEIRLAPVMLPAPAAFVEAPTPPSAATPFGFAPPTMEMRAELVYERALAAESEEPAALADAIVPDAEAGQSEPGRASVVFVDGDENGKRERRGALRRLIGSLRNKD